ncbi:MAG: hypothetical protein ACREIU_11680 [Planctomycetota bacterium]
MNRRRSPFWAWLPLVGALLVAGAPALRTYFLADDFFLFARTWKGEGADLRPVLEDFTGPWQGRSGVPYWRPLASLGWVPDALRFPADPLASHALNLTVHVLAVLAAYRLARRLFPAAPPGVAVLAAAVGAFGSTRAEPLGWVAGRVDLVPAALLLGGCARAIGWMREARCGSIAGPLALLAAALLWKESGIVGPLVLLGFDLAAPGSTRPGARSRLYLSLAALWVAYLGARVRVLGSLGGDVGAALLQPAVLAPGLLRSLAASAFPFDPEALGSASGSARLATFALACLVVVIPWRATSPNRIAGCLLAWVASALPAAPVPTTETLAGSRVLYLPGFAFALLLGVAGAPAFGEGGGRARRAVVGVAMVALAGIGAVSLRLGLDRWREAGELARRALEFLQPKVAGGEARVAVGLYPAGTPGIQVFLSGGPARVEGISPALVGPFARNRRAPLALGVFVGERDGAPFHALRQAGVRLVGFGHAGEEYDWIPPDPGVPVPLEATEEANRGGARTFRLRGGPVDPRRYAALAFAVGGAEGLLVSTTLDGGLGPSSFLGRVRRGRLHVPIGSDLAWWIAGETKELSAVLEGLPAAATIGRADLEADLPELELVAPPGHADALRLPQPEGSTVPHRLVLMAPTFTRERFLAPGAAAMFDVWSQRELRELGRALHGVEFAWFLEALEAPEGRRSASARSRIRFARMGG